MPETIRVRCPHCGSAMTVPAAYAGQEGNCSKCDGVLRIPDLHGDAPGGAAPAAPASKPEEFPQGQDKSAPDTTRRPPGAPPSRPVERKPPSPPAGETRPQPAASSAPGWPPAPDTGVRPGPAAPPSPRHAERGPVPNQAAPPPASRFAGAAALGWLLYAAAAAATAAWLPAFALGMLTAVVFVAFDGGRRLSRTGLVVWTLLMLPLWPLTFPWYLLGRTLPDGPAKLTPLRASLLLLLLILTAAAGAIAHGDLLAG